MAAHENARNVGTQIRTQHVAGSVINNTYFDGIPGSARAHHESKDGDHHDMLSSLAFPHMLNRQNGIREAHVTTCEWLLKLPEFNEWLHGIHTFMWIRGHPGAGKSTLMSYLCRHLQADAKDNGWLCLAFFFNARGHELEKTQAGMLRSLLHQLLQKAPGADDVTRIRYQEKQAAVGKDLFIIEWKQRELEDVFTRTVLACLPQQSILILVDALDEAGEQTAREVVKYFKQILRRANSDVKNLKICLSSRYYPVPATTEGLVINIDQHNGDDLSTFIHDNLDTGGEIDNSAQYIELLTARAAGNFQWVELILPMVEKHILDGEGWERVSTWLNEIPKTLANVYEHIIRDIISPTQRLSSFLLFLVTSVARRPLSSEEIFNFLAHASSVLSTSSTRSRECASDFDKGLNFQRRITSLSGGLLRTTSHHRLQDSDSESTVVVEVIHESVKDFLKQNGLATLEDLSQAYIPFLKSRALSDDFELEMRYDTLMHRLCLIYLENVDLEMLRRHSPGKKVNEIQVYVERKRKYGLAALYNLQHMAFLDYSATYLFEHALQQYLRICVDRSQYPTKLEQVRPKWLKLLNDKRKNWCYHADEPYYIHVEEDMQLLHIAAYFDLPQLLVDVIDSGRSINVTTASGRTPLYFAVQMNNLPMVNLLVREGAKLINPQPGLLSLLGVAALFDNVEMVQLLFDQGCTLDTDRGPKKDPVVIAICRENTHLTELFAAHIEELDLYRSRNIDLVSYAVGSGNLHILKSVLKIGFKVTAFEYKESTNGYMSEPHGLESLGVGGSLCLAAAHGRKEMLELLLSYGYDPNVLNGRAYLPTLNAAACGRTEVLDFLFAAGAEINAQNDLGESILHVAAKFNQVEAIRFSILKGAKIYARDQKDLTALQLAIIHESYEAAQSLIDAQRRDGVEKISITRLLKFGLTGFAYETICFLLLNGLGVQGEHDFLFLVKTAARAGSEKLTRLIRDFKDDFETPKHFAHGVTLMDAVCYGDIAMVEWLLSSGVNVNCHYNYSYGTPLVSAIICQHIKIIWLLLDRGALPNVRGTDRHISPLEAAISQYNNSPDAKDIVGALLLAGADVNPRGTYQHPPLHAAVLRGHIELVQQLIEAGADVNYHRKDLQSPYRLAFDQGHTAISKLLREHGATLN